MPSGIILSSGSQGATQEAIEKVLEAHGYEAEKPAAGEAEITEPARDDFESDEAFAKAKEEFDAKHEEAEDQREEQEEAEERKREQQEQKKPTRRQRAIEKATKQLREELRKSNERVAALEGKGRREPEAVKPPEAPKRDKFASDAEFEEAMFDYRYQLRRAKEQVEEARNNLAARQKENLENYQTQVAAFKEEHDDWDEVVNQKIPVHESVQLTIIELENGPQVTYYLGKHPDYARDLAELSPLKAVVQIARLADKLKAGRATEPTSERTSGKPKPRPRVPEPVQPSSTSATSSTLSSREAARKRDYKAFKIAQRKGA